MSGLTIAGADGGGTSFLLVVAVCVMQFDVNLATLQPCLPPKVRGQA